MDGAPERELHWSYLGEVPYRQAVGLQLAARDALRLGSGPERFLALEHPHVYTLGRNASDADVTATGEWLESRRVSVEVCDRGGQVTYHGPGQLVGYPVLSLSPDRRDIRRYVRDLQEVVIRTLAEFGLPGERRDGPEFIGVWSRGKKVASIGVHLSRWITTHGFALNVSTDLSYFSGIVPCGLREVEMASIESLTGERPQVAAVAAVAARHLAEVFARSLVLIA
ncbi:MAG: lipoyl(octanoyl) transferase LipB [Acidobacteriota bacterium]